MQFTLQITVVRKSIFQKNSIKIELFYDEHRFDKMAGLFVVILDRKNADK